MGERVRDPADLPPETIPIFPLPGVLLLPRARLPLHIFEPRYRAMARDALVGGRVIGMVQPRRPEAEGEAPPVFPIGCAGRMTDIRRTNDGRYYFTLIGLCRFAVRDEIEMKDGYRRVHADYGAYREDLAEQADGQVDRRALMAALRGYLSTRELSADWTAVEQLGDAELVATLAMACPFEPSEKQALLEAGDLPSRGGLLTAILEFGRLQGDEAVARH